VPLTSTALEHPDGHWHGWAWEVDRQALAPYVAHIALGRYRYTRKILHALAGEAALGTAIADPQTIVGAKRLLTAANPKRPYHRDGWLFQALSWIAARVDEDGTLTLSQPPHLIHAHKVRIPAKLISHSGRW